MEMVHWKLLSIASPPLPGAARTFDLRFLYFRPSSVVHPQSPVQRTILHDMERNVIVSSPKGATVVLLPIHPVHLDYCQYLFHFSTVHWAP